MSIFLTISCWIFEARFDSGTKFCNVKFVLQTTIVSFGLRIAAVACTN